MKDKIIVSGKRKRSVARALVVEGTGKVTVNKVPYELLPFFRKMMIEEPLKIAEELGIKNYDIEVNVVGGGQESQIEAARLAIARGLLEASTNKELRKAFLSYDRNLLVADTRRKEACKPNDSKARAKRQKSYR